MESTQETQRIRARSPWLTLSLVVGCATTVILILSWSSFEGALLVGKVALILTQLLPFVALAAVVLILPESFNSRRTACVTICGLLGILALLVPVYWETCSPHKPDALEGLALMIVGVAACVPMLVGVAVGAGISMFLGREKRTFSTAGPDR
jgi:hypothetical protein